MTLRAAPSVPRIEPSGDFGALIAVAVTDDGHRLTDGDVLVMAQEIVSKVEIASSP